MNVDVIRAWKDDMYRDSLSAEQRAPYAEAAARVVTRQVEFTGPPSRSFNEPVFFTGTL